MAQWLTLQVVRYEVTSPGDYKPTLWPSVILCYFSFWDSVAQYFQILWRVRKIEKMTTSFVMSFYPSVWLSVRPSFQMEHLAHFRRIFFKLGIWEFFENMSKFKRYYNLTLITGTLHEDLCTRVGTLIVATIYLQLIQTRYMFRSFTVLQCSHQHCVQPVASDVEVVGYLQQRLLCW